MELVKKYYISVIKTNISEIINYHVDFLNSNKIILSYISDSMYKNIPSLSYVKGERLEDGSYSVVLHLYDSLITIKFNLINYSGTTSSQYVCDLTINNPNELLVTKVTSLSR